MRVGPKFLIRFLTLAGLLAAIAVAHGPIAGAEPEPKRPALLQELERLASLGEGCQGGCAETGFFCAKPPGACAEPEKGVCKPKPAACTREYRPVCGCDGKNYSNACVAAAAGANIAHDGDCPRE